MKRFLKEVFEDFDRDLVIAVTQLVVALLIVAAIVVGLVWVIEK